VDQYQQQQAANLYQRMLWEQQGYGWNQQQQASSPASDGVAWYIGVVSRYGGKRIIDTINVTVNGRSCSAPLIGD
jgi:hypothetical protein